MSDSFQSKRCPNCGLIKPIDQFGLNKRMADGRARYCKECFQVRSKASYRKRRAKQGKIVRELPNVPEGSKYCPRCQRVKEFSQFGRNRAAKSGLTAYCKPCHSRVMAEQKDKKHGSTRNYLLKHRYGLTEDEVSEAVRQQGDFCLICLHRRKLHVDHNHHDGAFRGMLCFRCNGGLGQFKDNPAIMRRAVDYLEGRITEHYPPQPRRFGRAARGEPKSQRHYRLYKRYGIGADEVQALVDRQNGKCSICQSAPAVHVDHDHVTLTVRGVLCGDCNAGMGQLRDNSWVLRRAIEYLTGGLCGVRPDDDGGLEVAVVRPRKSAEAVDPGWDLGSACTDDLALLHALARPDSGELWETDVDLMGDEAYEPRFPVLDLSEPVVDEPRPEEPLGVPEDLCVLG